MSKVVFLTTADARYGFSLAGALQVSIPGNQAETRLRQEMADKETRVVVIDERLVHEIDEQHFAELENDWHGLLVILPTPETGEEEDALQRIIRRALGYHVRLQL